ncbi:MAG: flagellar hook-length control protein FliK [Gammaproteobacteria bacterium]|nr:flagellar hook-length control protein FliK [Gammaproteobacteria bacterium]
MSTPPTGPLLPPVATTPVSRSDTTLATWRVGQVLAATVVSSPQAGQTDLRIGNLLVKAQTGTLNLTAGQTLRLEVASLKEFPVLKLLSLMQQQSPVAQALRNVLPQQQPLTPLFSALTRVVNTPAPATTLNPAITRLVRELFTRLPDTTSVSRPNSLQQALRDSGMFLESKLAHSAVSQQPIPKGEPLARDFKANLLRLVQVLRENVANSAPTTDRSTPSTPTTPTAPQATAASSSQLASTLAAATSVRLPPGTFSDPSAPLMRGQPPMPPPLAALAQLARPGMPLTPQELLRHVEGALARVQLNQLSSLPVDRQLAPEWLIELPVRRDNETDIWSLRISRDQARDKNEAERSAPDWTVMLAFDLPGLGPMQTRVNLRGDQVTAQFFSQTQGILPIISEHLPLLKARLQQAGLQVNDLSCHHGQIPAPSRPPKTRILDERV